MSKPADMSLQASSGTTGTNSSSTYTSDSASGSASTGAAAAAAVAAAGVAGGKAKGAAGAAAATAEVNAMLAQGVPLGRMALQAATASAPGSSLAPAIMSNADDVSMRSVSAVAHGGSGVGTVAEQGGKAAAGGADPGMAALAGALADPGGSTDAPRNNSRLVGVLKMNSAAGTTRDSTVGALTLSHSHLAQAFASNPSLYATAQSALTSSFDMHGSLMPASSLLPPSSHTMSSALGANSRGLSTGQGSGSTVMFDGAFSSGTGRKAGAAAAAAAATADCTTAAATSAQPGAPASPSAAGAGPASAEAGTSVASEGAWEGEATLQLQQLQQPSQGHSDHSHSEYQLTLSTALFSSDTGFAQHGYQGKAPNISGAHAQFHAGVAWAHLHNKYGPQALELTTTTINSSVAQNTHASSFPISAASGVDNGPAKPWKQQQLNQVAGVIGHFSAQGKEQGQGQVQAQGPLQIPGPGQAMAQQSQGPQASTFSLPACIRSAYASAASNTEEAGAEEAGRAAAGSSEAAAPSPATAGVAAASGDAAARGLSPTEVVATIIEEEEGEDDVDEEEEEGGEEDVPLPLFGRVVRTKVKRGLSGTPCPCLGYSRMYVGRLAREHQAAMAKHGGYVPWFRACLLPG